MVNSNIFAPNRCLLIVLVIIISMCCGVNSESRVATSKINLGKHPIDSLSVHNKTALLAFGESLLQPRVQAVPWYLSILSCSTCGDIYDALYNYIKGKDITKAWKGGMHVLCLFWHDERSCMRYVETYYNLIMSDIFKGPLGSNFTCTEVF
jgi:hypothetical protein